MERFSTLPLPPAERRSFWRDLVAETFPGMTVDAGEGIRADLARATVGPIALASARSERARVVRTAGATDQRQIVLHLQRRGRLSLLQGAHEAVAMPGSIAIADDAEPYSIDISAGNDCLVLHLPAAMLGPAQDRTDWRARLLDGRDPHVALLVQTMTALWASGNDAELDPALADAVAVMVRVATDRAPAVADRATTPVGFALQHLVDPDLSTATIASAVGLSERGVQKAFMREVGCPPGAFIIDRRLARAADMLRARDGRSVTDIAFSIGFSDSSHFARAFRKRYAVPPSRWRGN